MAIDRAQVEHIAKLARLRLTDDEVERFAGQLTDVFGYIDQLQEVDVEGVEPTYQTTGRTDVVRGDVVTGSQDQRDELLEQFPERADDYLKVRSILQQK